MNRFLCYSTKILQSVSPLEPSHYHLSLSNGKTILCGCDPLPGVRDLTQWRGFLFCYENTLLPSEVNLQCEKINFRKWGEVITVFMMIHFFYHLWIMPGLFSTSFFQDITTFCVFLELHVWNDSVFLCNLECRFYFSNEEYVVTKYFSLQLINWTHLVFQLFS